MPRYANPKDVQYSVHGEGEPLLLIHGYMVTSEMFMPIVPHLVEQGYKLILPDLRGMGSNIELPSPYTFEQHYHDLNTILDREGLQQANVFGYSMGGALAQLLAIRNPERVHRLILGCTFSHKPVTAGERLQQRLLRNAILRIGAQGLSRLVYGELASNLANLDRKHVQWFRQTLQQHRDEVLLMSAYELFKHDTRKHLAQIPHPTLVVAARDDIVVPLHHAHQLAGKIPGSRLKVFDSGGHTLIFNQAEALARLVHGFLQDENRSWYNLQAS